MQSKRYLQEAIIKTFCYSDIFNYPLKPSEVFKFLISDKNFSKKEIIKGINEFLGNFLEKKGNLYFLKGREKTVNERKAKEKISRIKLKKVKHIVKMLSFIPTIELIGISGSLALLSAKAEDDIDLFIITSPNFLWITRLIVNIILLITNLKRQRLEFFHKDKFCLNMFMSQSKLDFETFDQNLFIAREMANLRVVFDRGGIYNIFLKSNSWTDQFLANFSRAVSIKNSKYKKRDKTFFARFSLNCVRILEGAVFIMQYLYMRKHITHERISLERACFHPFSYREFVLFSYTEKIRFYLKTYNFFLRKSRTSTFLKKAYRPVSA